jgi:phosphate transport system substrate-binding protein
VSEIGYQGRDPLTGESDTPQGRGYAYLPLVSGGTSFPYQVRVRGQLVRNLRLSGETLAKIFTNHITDWSDPQITRDNNGRQLPALPIIPVLHSEGSGSTAQFTRYLATEFPDLWRGFAGQDVFTEYFPRKGGAIAQSGSDGVMNFVSSAAANGSIGYDEYSYALGKDYPVAKLRNAAGVYTLPTEFNVAVALTQAVINTDKSSPDYLLQNLDRVYVFGDPRAYPLSSYSYFILPTAADDQKLTTAKRQTLADFIYYSICDGQKEVGPIGYSPLPVNLVQAGFEQVGKLALADPGVDLTRRDVSTCNNPTFIAGQPSRNYLAEIAPQPPACDHDGQGPCVEVGDITITIGINGTEIPANVDEAAAAAKAAADAQAAATAQADAATTDSEGSGSGGGGSGDEVALAQGGDTPAQVAEHHSVGESALIVGLVFVLLAIVLLAPGLAHRLAQRSNTEEGG